MPHRDDETSKAIHMTPVALSHIWLDDRGVAWIDQTNVKVIEVACLEIQP